MDSTDSGTPSSKEGIGAKEARRARQQSERERRTDRKRGGQPGHQGKGLRRDPDPDEKKDAEPPALCRRCGAGLGGAEVASSRWAQVIGVEIIRTVTEWALPGLWCRCCGTITFAEPPPGVHAGAVCYGPVLNAAAVLLSCYGNVPPERAAQVMGMLLGVPVSAGWVDKAAARVAARLGKAGFDEAMIAALAAEKVLAADETPVNVLDKTAPPAGHPRPLVPHQELLRFRRRSRHHRPRRHPRSPHRAPLATDPCQMLTPAPWMSTKDRRDTVPAAQAANGGQSRTSKASWPSEGRRCQGCSRSLAGWTISVSRY